MRLTIKHYFDFQEQSTQIGKRLDNSLSWDILRVESGAGSEFFIPADRLSWEKKCLQNEKLKTHAEDIVRIIQHQKFQRVNSFGVGDAFLEYWIKRKLPGIFLQCSDYTPKAIDRLKTIFTGADEIISFDMLKDPWSNDGFSCLYLFYRIDTAFDDQQWKDIFANLSKHQIKNILFVPGEFLTIQRFLRQKIKLLLYTMLLKKNTFAGYLRNKEQMETLFSENYEIRKTARIGDITGYLLMLKENRYEPHIQP